MGDKKYPITAEQQKDLDKRFSYHAPKDDQPDRYVSMRAAGLTVGQAILENTPKSREQSLALTNLEQAIMWANAAIARNE